MLGPLDSLSLVDMVAEVLLDEVVGSQPAKKTIASDAVGRNVQHIVFPNFMVLSFGMSWFRQRVFAWVLETGNSELNGRDPVLDFGEIGCSEQGEMAILVFPTNGKVAGGLDDLARFSTALRLDRRSIAKPNRLFFSMFQDDERGAVFLLTKCR